MEFRWNSWNIEHATKHGVSLADIISILNSAKGHETRKAGKGKRMVVGRGQGGRMLQVAYVLDADGTAHVIHARPLTSSEKRRFRRHR